MSYLEFESQAGKPIPVGRTRLIPFIHSIRINFPRSSGCILWRRPVSLHVQNSAEEEQIIPIINVTRQAQLTILGLGLLGSLLIWVIYRRKGA